MAQRAKHSISLSRELASAIEQAAKLEGTTFSGWISEAAAHRLRIEAGQRALVEWERDHGALTEAELAEGRARARTLLGRGKPSRKRRSA